MHEASLMKDLMGQLTGLAETQGARRIVAIEVWLGALSHMSPEHFQEHFDQAAKGTLAEGAELRATLSDDITDPNAQTILLKGMEVEAAE